MQIKVRAEQGGGATAWVVNPSTGETLEDSTRDLEPGQEVVVTAVNAHEPSDIEVAAVTGGDAPVEETAPAEQPEGGAPEQPAEAPAEGGQDVPGEPPVGNEGAAPEGSEPGGEPAGEPAE